MNLKLTSSSALATLPQAPNKLSRTFEIEDSIEQMKRSCWCKQHASGSRRVATKTWIRHLVSLNQNWHRYVLDVAMKNAIVDIFWRKRGGQSPAANGAACEIQNTRRRDIRLMFYSTRHVGEMTRSAYSQIGHVIPSTLLVSKNLKSLRKPMVSI